jgi:hypothetical protein
MRKLNKRGFWMGEESGKFILGVIAIVLLFLLAFKLAGIMRQNTQYEQAKYTMSQIENAISSIKEGEAKTVFVESPKDWYLMSFSKEQGFDKIPSSCGGQNCLCLCPKAKKEICEQKGICRAFDKKNFSSETRITGIIPLEEVLTQFILVPLTISFLKEGEKITLDPSIISTEKIWDLVLEEEYQKGLIKTEFVSWTEKKTNEPPEIRNVLGIPNRFGNAIKDSMLSIAKKNKINIHSGYFFIRYYKDEELEKQDFFGFDERKWYQKMPLTEYSFKRRLIEKKIIGGENRKIELELTLNMR